MRLRYYSLNGPYAAGAVSGDPAGMRFERRLTVPELSFKPHADRMTSTMAHWACSLGYTQRINYEHFRIEPGLAKQWVS
jgi:hypothetical protein